MKEGRGEPGVAMTLRDGAPEYRQNNNDRK